MSINYCPCCRGALLRHVKRKNLYWFCTSCRQEMPVSGVKKILPYDSLVSTLESKLRQPKTAV
ncbi:MAG TPA: hypothetical protein DEG17_18200 [Cyanobacteria bacterium UBA11149]|nr:hypothetical protein [Cyanobacteria bacterium UBA11367]HBE59495.1 hypothetical protein [Cyanobacteria bacterium UBA11366]HBK66873.1 hypothetical protein [Cyanobacteria bacterium UBA11166]HBR76842.1 hypothetical protein [Cyanobacteria bacterium UBA11159]HBS72599.1 hypothetical protein [Cyanobacteria bacterium UBA11153]HBW90751.1 hypothetical protein [Cyanobacteria bacterium UBA11149]HCA93682.1 hypothetical protein [Cyanobacteria bacterium UBA9226]